MIPHRHGRFLAGALVALASLAFVACGSDDDDTAPRAPEPVATAPVSESPPPTPAPAGEPPSPDATAHTEHTGAAAPTIAVGAVDYSFQDLPASVTAGTALTLTNHSTTELHEIVAFRLPDDETRSVEELMALPDTGALEAAIAVGPPALVMLAPPGQQGFAALGDGSLDEPGRYVLLCGIPIGADVQAYLDAARTADGPPDVPGGPPHFTAGMFAELVVEPA
jgi:hypothetical protein